MLAGAGLNPGDVTPELARNFGEILRVVVSGVIDVMQSRQQIKEEFGLRTTRVRPAENNPLKFSVDANDALHNLLVKRNPGYLAPVAAFEDAFADLRDHQMAMLAGMRVAFESMLAEFDPGPPAAGIRPSAERPRAGESSVIGISTATGATTSRRTGKQASVACSARRSPVRTTNSSISSRPTAGGDRPREPRNHPTSNSRAALLRLGFNPRRKSRAAVDESRHSL